VTSTAEAARALGAEMAKARDNLTVKEINLAQSLSLGPGVQWPKAMTNDEVSLTALAGIACSAETPPINLIPTAVQQTQEKRIYQRQLLMVGLWVAAALISLGLALGMGYIKKNIQLARLQDQLRDTKQDSIAIEGQLQKIHDIEGMIKGRLIFADLAREIYRLLPAQIYLVSITISDGNTLSFQGVSSSTVEINQFQKSMADSKNFSNGNLDYVNKRVTQEGEVDYFKIRCTVNTRNGPK
jgi:Tfp pilus assembly protein PilN